MYMVYNL